MKLLTIPLQAGQTWPINRGRFIRVFDALYPVKIETTVLNGGSNQDTKMLANTGAEFTPFSKAVISSEKTQTVTIAYSELPIFDNRIGVADATVMQVVAPQIVRRIESFSVDSLERVKVLDSDIKRKSATVAAVGECTFFDAEVGGSGFKINGDFDDCGNNELWCIATTAASVEVMGFYYD